MNRLTDKLGVACGTICVAHCVVFPLLMSLSPILFTRLWMSGLFIDIHKYLFFVSVLLAVLGGITDHKNWAANALIFIGLLGLYMGAYQDSPAYYSIAGGIMCSAGHILRLTTKTSCCR